MRPTAKDAWALLRLGYEGTWPDRKISDPQILAHPQVIPLSDTGAFVAHPPTGKWVIALGEWMFGPNPFGRRFMMAVLGTLSVLMLCRIGRRPRAVPVPGPVAAQRPGARAPVAAQRPPGVPAAEGARQCRAPLVVGGHWRLLLVALGRPQDGPGSPPQQIYRPRGDHALTWPFTLPGTLLPHKYPMSRLNIRGIPVSGLQYGCACGR